MTNFNEVGSLTFVVQVGVTKAGKTICRTDRPGPQKLLASFMAVFASRGQKWTAAAEPLPTKPLPGKAKALASCKCEAKGVPDVPVVM